MSQESFHPSDLVFVMWEQDGKINQFHLAHYPDSGRIRTSCGMLVSSEHPPTHATTEKPAGTPCCSSCEGRSRAFSLKYFGGRTLPVGSKRMSSKQKPVADGMTASLHVEKRKPGELF